MVRARTRQARAAGFIDFVRFEQDEIHGAANTKRSRRTSLCRESETADYSCAEVSDFLSAVARLLSASSSVLRDVAMFMRM